MNKFQANLGTVVVTPVARISMQEQGVQVDDLLQQHLNINWNNSLFSLPETEDFIHSRLISTQKIPLGELWVITELDSHTTTITHPDELNS